MVTTHRGPVATPASAAIRAAPEPERSTASSASRRGQSPPTTGGGGWSRSTLSPSRSAPGRVRNPAAATNPTTAPDRSTTATQRAPPPSAAARASATVVSADRGHRRLGREVVDPAQTQAAQRPFPAQEGGHELVGRGPQQLVGPVVLGQHAALGQDGHPVAELDGLVDVVGDDDDRLAHLGLQGQQVVLQFLPHQRVDGAVGLVHEQDRRVGGQGPGHPYPLLLAARQLGRVAAGHVGSAGRPGPGVRPPARRSGPWASPAGRGRRRCWPPPCGGGTGRSAGSRSRCCAAARAPAASVWSRPSTWIVPDVGSIRRLIILSVVVLPQPEGPTRATTSPAATSSDSPSTAGVAAPGYRLVRSRIDTAIPPSAAPIGATLPRSALQAAYSPPHGGDRVRCAGFRRDGIDPVVGGWTVS